MEMKKLLVLMLLAASPICMMGQTRVIKGYVVDKKTGNYLPGAEVTATGGAESTTTDADGSFSLEVGRFVKSATARYAGMADKKMRIGEKEELVFRMRKDKGFGFLNFEGGLVVGPKLALDGTYNRALGVIGLMGGYLDKWGVYGKFTINPWGKEILPMGSVGATKRIFSWLHASLGLGVGLGLQYHAHFSSNSTYYVYPLNPENNYYSNRYYADCWPEPKMQVMPEIGVFFKISKHLLANLHYGIGICASSSDPYYSISESTPNNYSSDSYIRYESSYNSGCKESTGLNHNLSIGIGYIF